MGEEMSFWDHLEELRWCLFRVVIAFAVALVGCFAVLPSVFDTVILGPAHSDFFLYRWLGFIYGAAEDVDIININVTSQFMTHISVSMWMALLLVFPYLMYQIWVFVRPALYSREVRGVRAEPPEEGDAVRERARGGGERLLDRRALRKVGDELVVGDDDAQVAAVLDGGERRAGGAEAVRPLERERAHQEHHRPDVALRADVQQHGEKAGSGAAAEPGDDDGHRDVL